MGRPKEETRRVNHSVAIAVFKIIAEDMRRKGYQNGNGLMFKEYWGAIAAEMVKGKINIPNRLTE